MKYFCALLLLLVALPAAARPYIDITGGNPTPYPIAIAEPVLASGIAAADAEAGKTAMQVVRADLGFSGYFNVLDPRGYLASPTEGLDTAAIKFDDWLKIGVQGLVKVGIERSGGSLKAQARLFEVAAGQMLWDKRYSGDAAGARKLGHEIANDLFEYFTREPGIFGQHIVYVEKQTANQSAIRLMDYDGARDGLLYRNGAINILPSWRPDGGAILFTGYLHGNPDLYRIMLGSKLTQRVSARYGINSGAVYSPDGKKIALTLSHGENSEIYVMNAEGKDLMRLTNDWQIDTSPTWSPDGKRIAWVSARSGRPHLHVMNADGSEKRRLTFVGDYNQEPRWSPRGDWIAFTARDERYQFDIFLISPDDSNKIVRLTQDQGHNEAPSWAPNGRYLAFQSTRQGGVSQVYIMDWNGEHQRRITQQKFRCEQPVWEPFKVDVKGDLEAIDAAPANDDAPPPPEAPPAAAPPAAPLTPATPSASQAPAAKP